MARTLFIVNPKAGRGAALRTWKQIEKLVAAIPGTDAVIPASYEETRRQAAEAARLGIERVVTLGGGWHAGRRGWRVGPFGYHVGHDSRWNG